MRSATRGRIRESKRARVMNSKRERGQVMSGNRIIAESIVNSRSKERLIETIEYYLNELDKLEGKSNG